MQNDRSYSSLNAARVDTQSLIRMVYVWMTVGLLITSGVAIGVPALGIVPTQGVMIGAVLVEFVLVIALNLLINRLSPVVAGIMFLTYAAVNGFTLSLIFWVYTGQSIIAAFLATVALFGAMTIIGFTTSIDLLKYRSYLLIGIIGLIVAGIINIFLQSNGFDFIISLFGVALFTALTAYDTQKIKRIAASRTFSGYAESAARLSILGALHLYLDFVNLFLYLLRLMRRRR